MGREYRPGKFAVLLDFDNKVEGDSRNGVELVKLFNLKQYKAPKQNTPFGGLHYIFFVDAEQAKHAGSRAGITHKGEKYNMDVKFKNGLCNCQPSKIEGHGEYKRVSPFQLLDIPKLPNDIFELIRKKTPFATAAATKTATATTTKTAPETASKKELDNIVMLCECLSISQLDD